MPLFEGMIVRTSGAEATVRDAEGVEWRCVLRGRLRMELRGATSPVAVGDRVAFRPAGEREGAIERLLPRRSRLVRRAPSGHDRGVFREQVLAANVDLAVIVVACPPRATVIDRYLALATGGGRAPLVVANKIDLAAREIVEGLLASYVAAGIPVVLTSALTGEGVESLRAELGGRLAAFVGPSGAGKSSLLNALDPSLDLRVGALNVAGKGSHTTSWAAIYALGGGFVVDTPGLREIAFAGDGAHGTMFDLFPEIAALAAGCRFRDCSHTHEPDCAVQAALDAGELDEDTYRRFVRLERAAAPRQPGKRPRR